MTARLFRSTAYLLILSTAIWLLTMPATSRASEVSPGPSDIFLLAQASAADCGGSSTEGGFRPIELAPPTCDLLDTPCLESETCLPSVVNMECAVCYALGHNHNLDSLRYQVQAAEAKVKEADVLYWPTLGVAGRVSSVGPPDTVEIPLPENPLKIQIISSVPLYTASVSLTQPVYTFGTFPLAQRAASLALESARLQLARAEETLRNDVETAFLQAALTRALADVARQAVSTAEERLRISQQRFDAGTVARFEVLRSEVALATTRQQLLEAETAAQLAMSALIQKLGLDPGTGIGINPPDPEAVVPEPPSMTLEEAREAAFASRSDLKALGLAVDLAQVDVESQRNRPMLGFQGSYSQSDHATGLQQKTNWSLGLNLSYTLIDSGRARAAMDEAASRRDSVRASLEETRSLVALQVERAYSSLTQALDRINVARATLDSASEAVRIAEIGYSEGVITYIDYQDADLGYRQAETMYLQAIYGYLIAESSLRAALGGAKTRAETDAACP